MRFVSLIIFCFILSCNQIVDQNSLTENESLKNLKKLSIEFVNKETGENLNLKDTLKFHTYNIDSSDKMYKNHQILRVISKGWAYILFGQIENKECDFYNLIKVPIVAFMSDTIYDINGDGFKDFLMNEASMNGQCQPNFSTLLCLDTSTNLYKEVEEIKSLPNVRFDPNEKTVFGEWECKMTKDVYKFKWTSDFKLDTILFQSLKMH